MNATEKLDALNKCGVDEAIQAMEQAVQMLWHDKVRCTAEGQRVSRILNDALNELYDERNALENKEDEENDKRRI